MKSASDNTPMALTAFGLLMDPGYLRQAAGDTRDGVAHAALDRVSHRTDRSRLLACARTLRFWVFHRAAH